MSRTPTDSPVSSLALIAAMARHIRLIALTPVIFGALAGVASLVRGPVYSAHSSFIPQVGIDNASRFAGIAAQLGFSIDAGNPGESIQFYARLLTSDALLRNVVQSEFRFADPPGSPDTLSGTFIELLDVGGDTEHERVLRAIDMLRDRIAVTTHLDAGVIGLETTVPWPELAVQINRRLLDEVDTFNRESRQSRAAMEREFVGERLKEAKKDLEGAEAALQNFLERNRTYETSPELTFEAGRLERRVSLRQQVYSSLAQAFEQARIEEVRNTPVVTVVDHPEGTARRSSSGRLLVAVAVAFGLLSGMAASLGIEYLRWKRVEKPEEFAVLVRISRDMLKQLGWGRRSSTGSRV